jgi:hypothetical protein
MQNPPGQGLSKKARQRRNKRATTTTIVTQQRKPPQQQQQILVTRTVTKTGNRRGRRNQGQGTTSLYLRSLTDPENGSGARCPDATAVPTGTFQLTADIFATYVESPSGAVRVSGIAVNPFDMSYANVTAVGDDGSLTWGAATALPARTSASAIYG